MTRFSYLSGPSDASEDDLDDLRGTPLRDAIREARVDHEVEQGDDDLNFND